VDGNGATYWPTPFKDDDKQTAEKVVETLVGDENIYAFGEKTLGRRHVKRGDWLCFYAWAYRSMFGILLMVGNLMGAASLEVPKRVIIDTDPGTDDALAILLALNSPELKVEALTVVPGNVTAAQGLENALKLVSLAGRPDIPVASGAQKPLLQKLVTAESHGLNGLADINLPPSRCSPDSRFAPDLIIELAHRYPHEVTLVTLGPLTNIALALNKDPSLAGLVKEVVMMGGAISGGNIDAVAEFNIYVDPEAAQIVFNGGWPLTMIGLEIGRKALFHRAHLARLKVTHGAQNDFAAEVLEYRINLSEKSGLRGTPLYDPTALAATIDRTLITTQLLRVDIELRGEFTRAETVANRQNALNRKVQRGDHLVFQGTEPLEPNVHVAMDIDTERFMNLLIARLSGK
jgi:inosine-uridine nucleoside N-ribohydrolase